MKDLNRQVLAALEAYLARGKEALKTLEVEGERGAEAFFQVMQTRDHAFHNFRALEALAMAQGHDIALNPEARQIWYDIDRVNRTLFGVMKDAETRLGQRLARVKVGKAQSQAYLSGNPRILKLVKQI